MDGTMGDIDFEGERGGEQTEDEIEKDRRASAATTGMNVGDRERGGA
jgi:hypothetical protein